MKPTDIVELIILLWLSGWVESEWAIDCVFSDDLNKTSTDNCSCYCEQGDYRIAGIFNLFDQVNKLIYNLKYTSNRRH